jgi:uncharacterized membrane protein YjgN (DUF898 family)
MASSLAHATSYSGQTTAAPGPKPHTLEYVGPTGTMFGIFYKNLVLTILTLGIYRFWAKTRERRFLWANTHIDGEGFEYTGTGKELFLGFLKAVVILVPLFVGLQLVELFVLDESMIGIAVLSAVRAILILGLVYAGTFAARKYRMSRTTWRGIRLQQDGSIWTYAGMALLGMLFTVLTLGLYLPFLQAKLMRYELGNLRFGSAPFRFTGTGKLLFKRFIVIWAVFAALIFLFAVYGIGLKAHDDMGLHDPSTQTFLSLIPLAFILILGPLFLWYQARVYRFQAEHTFLDGLAFAMPTLSGWRIFRLMVGNYFIMMLSLGILTPYTTQRTMRFWTRHTQLAGDVDLDRIAQAARGPGTGEGLAGFFDVDVG